MSVRLSTGEVSVPSPAAWLRCLTEAGEHGSVLVAAHDPDLRRQVCRPLLEHGLAVVEAADAEEAVRLARKAPVEVAIVEVDRPGLDGAEVFRRWQEIGPGRYVPLVLLTRRSAPDDVAASIHLGAHDYVLAPVDAFDVLARVHSALAAKHRHDSFRREVSELQQLVLTDPLTGLYNRRHMEAELAALVSAARRRGTPLGILLVDVDRFKRINDRLGHHAGDTALRTVAHRIRSVVRAEDVVGRWGGDEFVVFLPSTDQAAAVTLARRLRGAVAQPGAGDSLEVPITVSVGCAAGVGEASTLISAADAALRRAKAGGRNRVGV